MSDEKNSNDRVTVESELNNLLDSALEDFDKPPKTKLARDRQPGVSSAVERRADESSEELADEAWSQDFIKRVADQFEKNVENLMENGGGGGAGEDGDLGSSLQRMAQSVANAIATNPSAEETDGPDFQAAIARALKDLSATSENLQDASPGITEADLAAMFGQTTLEDGPSDVLPFMQGIMQSLLSKQVLYPSLKELVDKYPAWLEEKKTTLSPDDYEKYSKQLHLMKQVCTELEKENDSDTEDARKKRFETILALMQEMQNYGQPPEDLVGDEQSALFQIDPEGNSIMPAFPAGVDSPQNCSIV